MQRKSIAEFNPLLQSERIAPPSWQGGLGVVKLSPRISLLSAFPRQTMNESSLRFTQLSLTASRPESNRP